jgi:hypothetical protein
VFLHQIDDRVRKNDVERHAGMLLEKERRHRDDMAHSERNVAIDPEMSAGTGAGRRFPLGFIHVGEHTHGAAIECAALGGELQAAR